VKVYFIQLKSLFTVETF